MLAIIPWRVVLCGELSQASELDIGGSIITYLCGSGQVT